MGIEPGRSGVELSEPNWFQYHTETSVLSQSSIWPLQPKLTPVEIEGFNPLLGGAPTFIFTSPNERFLVYCVQDTQQLAVADRQRGQTYLIPDVQIPSPDFGPDEFNVLWSADSSTFTVMYAPTYGEDFGTIYVRGFASEPANITVSYPGFAVDGRGFRNLKIHDLSSDGRQVILSGVEVFPNSDIQDTRTKLILRDIANPEESQILESLSGMIQGVSFMPDDDNSLLLVNERGLVEYDRTTNESTVLNSEISADWVSRAIFSPDGEHIALIQRAEPVTNIFVVNLADLPIATPTVTTSATNILTQTPTATDTATSTPSNTPTATFTPTETLTNTPTPTN